MEDKKTALAIFLCFIVVMMYSELVLAPQLRKTETTPVTQSAAVQTSGTSAAPASGAPAHSSVAASDAAPQTASAHPTLEDLAKSPFTNLQSQKVSITITHLGARLRSYKLSDYKDHLDSPELYDMVSHLEGGPLPGGVQVGTLRDEHVLYTLKEVSAGAAKLGDTYQIPSGGELSLVFEGQLPSGPTITKRYTFGPTPYLFKVDIHLSQQVSDVSRVWFEWSLFLTPTKAKNTLNPNGFVLLDKANKITHVAMADAPLAPADHGSNSWVGLTDKYFIASLIPNSDGMNTRIGREGDVYYSRVSGTTTDANITLYVGPKDTDILKPAGYQLERSIDLGWFSPIAYPLLSIIRFFYSIFGNYGLAIILLTLLIKTLFLPLTKASFSSMRKMQDLQPEMKALKDRIKDATELNKEVLALYKKRGVNPMGGCLPMLVQLPVFLGLYNALLNSIELRNAPFALWIKDLSTPEGLMVFGIPIPVMVLIMGASMYFQQLTTPQTGDPQQQKIMKMMPIIFTIMFIIFPMPAGLVLYWLTNNTISIIQQVYLRGHRKASPLTATAIASVAIFGVGYVLTLI